jgi:TolC family type I secretion outer membrane protein
MPKPLAIPMLTAAMVALAAALSAAAPSAGAAPNPSPALSLEECIRTALSNNPSLKASRASVSSALESEGGTRSAYFPQIALQAGYSRWESRAFLPDSILTLPPLHLSPVIGPTNQYSLDLQGSYTLFDSGLRRAQVAGAKAAREAAGEAAAQDTQDLVLNVTSSYYGLLAAQANLAVAKQSLKRSEDHLRLAEDRKAVGAVPLADVLRARVEVANARLAQVHAASGVEVARGALAASMGLSPDTPLAIQDAGAEVRPPALLDPAQALAEAQARRPEVKAAERRVEAGRASVRAARSAYGPTVELDASYGRLDNTYFPQDKNWSAGIVLRLPVFTGFARSHALARARTELGRAEDRRDEAALAVRQEVWNALARLREAYNAVLAVRALTADAKESLRMADERYKVGAGTITDLLDAETNLAQAQAQQVDADFQYRVAGANLKRALGELEAPEGR